VLFLFWFLNTTTCPVVIIPELALYSQVPVLLGEAVCIVRV
jgi:hypothetical protein